MPFFHAFQQHLPRSLGESARLSKVIFSTVTIAGFTVANVLVSDSASAQTPTGLPSLVQPTQPASSETLAVPSTISNPSPTPVPDSAYTLGAGDSLRIDIFRVPQYSTESPVLSDGTLNLPLIGKVNVKGLSIETASERISRQYAQYLRRPLVTLTLLNRRPVQVGIAGEVGSPGTYTFAQQDAQVSRLSQLIQTAGGITKTADLSAVQVKRTQADGREETIQVNLWDLIQNGNLGQDLTLQDGDAVFIPTAFVAPEDAALLADVSFAGDTEQPINVAVVGEVYRPGPYTLRGGIARTADTETINAANIATGPTTITKAIQVAGGIKPQADIRNVQVVRPTRAGQPQIFDVNLWQLLQTGDLRQDAVLQEGDTILVPTATALSTQEVGQLAAASFSPDTIRVNVVGEVEQSGTVELPPSTPLSQAILAAGGFTNRARQGSAELVRINEDGTVTRTAIPVDFAEGIDEENNPLLRNDDVIIVNRNGLATVGDAIGTVTRPLSGIFSIFRFFDIFD